MNKYIKEFLDFNNNLTKELNEDFIKLNEKLEHRLRLINDAVKKSAKRARLTVITSPTAYKEGIESTYISTTNLRSLQAL